jgi:hypothetical protein
MKSTSPALEVNATLPPSSAAGFKHQSADFYHDLIYKDYDDIFLTQLPPPLPPLRVVNHHIPVKIDTPWIAPYYHLPEVHKRALDKDIDLKLQAGIVVPTTNVPLATSHMVPKRDPGTYRHVQDLRRRNKDNLAGSSPSTSSRWKSFTYPAKRTSLQISFPVYRNASPTLPIHLNLFVILVIFQIRTSSLDLQHLQHPGDRSYHSQEREGITGNASNSKTAISTGKTKDFGQKSGTYEVKSQQAPPQSGEHTKAANSDDISDLDLDISTAASEA